MGRQDYETETMVVGTMGANHSINGNHERIVSCTLPASDGGVSSGMHPVVAFAQNQRDEVRIVPVAGALSSQPGMKQQTYLSQRVGVRRLTPVECERLQGFPEGWTLGFSDTQRYKMMGNAVTVNVIRAIASRLIK